MKNLVIFGSILFAFFSKAQTGSLVDTIQLGSWQEARELIFGLLPKSHYPSGYLLNKSTLMPKMGFANGELSDSSFNMLEWYFMQNTIKMSYNNPDSIIDYLKVDSVKEKFIADNNILPFGVINMNTHIIKDSSIVQGLMNVVEHRFVENSADIDKLYAPVKVFCVSPLNMEVYTLNPQFIILPNFVFSNDSNTITQIQIDLDDGLGYRNIETNNVFQASYTSGGYKFLTAKIIFNNGDTLFSRSELNVVDNNMQDIIETCYEKYDHRYFIGSSAGNGEGPGGAYPPEFTPVFDNTKYIEVGVWYACGNVDKKVRKPFIVFGGYNPKDGKTLLNNNNPSWVNDAFGSVFALDGWRGPLYETYDGFYTDLSKNGSYYNGNQSTGTNGNRFLDKLRQEGYDVLIVRFHDGIGYLQLNAYLITLFIKDLNYKILNHTDVFNPGAALDPEAPGYPNTSVYKNAKHELIVSGYSAGALSSRLGLLLMEYEHEKYKCDINTETGLLKKSRSSNHRTKLWLGFDYEAQGSNVPIGQQMFCDFQKSVFFMPSNVADLANSLISDQVLKLLGDNGVATQNTLYHINNTTYVANDVWNVGHHPDFDGYFNDLTAVSTLPSNRPANLIGYPTQPYRISVSQGNANGIEQKLVASYSRLLFNQSPTAICINPWGAAFGLHNFLTSITPYREAEAFALMQNNRRAFSCRIGTTFKFGIFAFHIKFPHWKYNKDNLIQDLYEGANTWRSLDVDPGSTLPSHIIYGSKLPLSSKTLAAASLSFCNYIDVNPNQHGFCPTVSGLDLHYPGQNTLPRLPNLNYQIPGNVNGGLNLMQQNNYISSSVPKQSPHYDFGYPHLTFPNNHYDITPFDAIWAHGENFNTTNYDDNTMHVEDPSPYIGEFLVEEIAPYDLYLSNRTIAADSYNCGEGIPFKERYYADFEARNNVLAGNQTIYEHNAIKYARQRTSPGDFIVGDGGIVTIRANNYNGTSSVTLGAGFSAKAGSIFRAYVFTDPNMCGPFNQNDCSFRPSGNENNKPSKPVKEQRSIYAKRASKQKLTSENKQTNFTLYPNPSNGAVYYVVKELEELTYSISDLTGKVIETGTFNGKVNTIDLSKLDKGIYLITVTGKEYKQTDRIILQ